MLVFFLYVQCSKHARLAERRAQTVRGEGNDRKGHLLAARRLIAGRSSKYEKRYHIFDVG